MTTTEFNTEHGKVTSDGSWKYWQLNGVNDVQVQLVSPLVHSAIQALVDEKRSEYEREQAKLALDKQEKDMRERNAWAQGVLRQLQGSAHYSVMLRKGYKLSSAVASSLRRFTVCGTYGGQDYTCTIDHDPKVYSPGAWSSHTTENCWKIEYDWDSKDRAVRFKNVEKALAEAVRRVDAKIAQAKYNAEQAEQRKSLSSVARELLGDDFRVREDTLKARAHVELPSGKIGVRAKVAQENNNELPVFTDMKLDGCFTAEQMKRLFEIVKDMQPKGTYVSDYD